jgi:Spy/CpxP family protein refolding chaperone
MERIRIGMLALAVLLAAGLAQAQDNKKKKAAEAGPSGPYGLPLLASVKEKLKLTAEQEPKVSALYDEGAKEEEATRKRAKENQTDRKDLEKFLAEGKSTTVNKIRELLDDGQKKSFDALVSAAAPKKK